MFSAAQNYFQHAVSGDKCHLKMSVDVYAQFEQSALLTGDLRRKNKY